MSNTFIISEFAIYFCIIYCLLIEQILHWKLYKWLSCKNLATEGVTCVLRITGSVVARTAVLLTFSNAIWVWIVNQSPSWFLLISSFTPFRFNISKWILWRNSSLYITYHFYFYILPLICTNVIKCIFSNNHREFNIREFLSDPTN